MGAPGKTSLKPLVVSKRHNRAKHITQYRDRLEVSVVQFHPRRLLWVQLSWNVSLTRKKLWKPVSTKWVRAHRRVVEQEAILIWRIFAWGFLLCSMDPLLCARLLHLVELVCYDESMSMYGKHEEKKENDLTRITSKSFASWSMSSSVGPIVNFGWIVISSGPFGPTVGWNDREALLGRSRSHVLPLFLKPSMNTLMTRT